MEVILGYHGNMFRTEENMNDLNNMMPICHDCPYWEVCEPPYVCSATEAKYRNQDKEDQK